nr:hypothetical protein [uncultured Rhodopila sp.]
MKISSVDLRGRLDHIGPIEFVRAEWSDKASRFVLLKYEIDGKPRDRGVRMDLDKRILMEDLESPELNFEVCVSSPVIWAAVVDAIAAHEQQAVEG